MKEQDQDNTRRKFLATGLLALAAGCTSKHPFTPSDGGAVASGETVKLLSVDGEISYISRRLYV